MEIEIVGFYEYKYDQSKYVVTSDVVKETLWLAR
jgi:hypothetical protein